MPEEIDKEKVIKGLKACCSMNMGDCEHNCPYYCSDRFNTAECHRMYEEAVALIESAPSKAGRMKIAPVIRYSVEFRENSVIGYLVCGHCGKAVATGDHYCRHCGTEVDWDAKDLAWRRYAPGGTSP